jgi:hypothetical protein
LGVAAQHRERLVGIEAEAFHQHALGLSDQFPGVDRLPQVVLVSATGQRDRRMTGQQMRYSEVVGAEPLRLGGVLRPLS